MNNKSVSTETKSESLTQYKNGYDVSKLYVQVAVFSKIKRAQSMYMKLAEDLPEFDYSLKSERDSADATKKRYILRAGPFENQTEAESALVKIQNLSPDFKDSIVID